MDRPFAVILDECLDRALLHGETVDACVADYREHAAALREALKGALSVLQAASFHPDQARKRASRLRFLEAVDQRSRQGWLRHWLSNRLIGTRSRWAMAISTLAITLVMGSTGTVMAAEGSIPGDPLYPVKRVGERTRLMPTFTNHREADVQAQLLDRRMDELQAVTDKGAIQFVSRLVDEIGHHSQRARILTIDPVSRAVAAWSSDPRPPAFYRVPANQLLRLHYQLGGVEERLNRLFDRPFDSRTRGELGEVVQTMRTQQRHTTNIQERIDAAYLTEDQPRQDAPLRDRDNATEGTSATPQTPMRRVRVKVLSVDVVVGPGPPRLDLTIEIGSGERQLVHLSPGATHLLKTRLPGTIRDLRIGSDVVLEVQPGTDVIRYVLIAE